MQQDTSSIPLTLALLPIVLLVSMLGLSVYYFSDGLSYGANQIALLIVAAIAAAIGVSQGHKWKDLEQAIISGVSNAMIAILLVVGALIGTWMLSGTVQSLIYYYLKLIDPKWFYVATCMVFLP